MDRQSFIYKFLLAPRFSIWRYLSLIVFFIIISLNQAFAGYMEIAPRIGNNIYWIVAVTILVYIISVIIISKKVSKLLLSRKYLIFVTCIILCACLFVAITNIIYYMYTVDYNFFSEVVIMDNISSFAIYILCITGIIIPVFLRNWIISSQHLSQLKIKQASSQIEQFKEQINPPSFFKILNQSKNLVKTEPDKASAMLISMSQLLRYQLYDCNRTHVLLSAEISFLQNFLELEKLYSSRFGYSIKAEGNVNGIFILPSILLPYVQCVINALDNEKEVHTIDVLLNHTEQTIDITLDVSGVSNTILLQKELLKVKERLNVLYRSSYKLSIGNDTFTGKTTMVLQLEKE